MGLGRKIDPEPGRCRRTDGKKWRCSKEAYPDSKYCERHMHRGKNRSRKPVEVLKTTTNNASTFANSSNTKNSSSLSFDTQQHQNYPQNSIYGSNLQHSFMYPQTTSRSSASSGIGLSFEDNNASLFLDSNSCSQNNGDYRFFLKPWFFIVFEILIRALIINNFGVNGHFVIWMCRLLSCHYSSYVWQN